MPMAFAVKVFFFFFFWSGQVADILLLALVTLHSWSQSILVVCKFSSLAWFFFFSVKRGKEEDRMRKREREREREREKREREREREREIPVDLSVRPHPTQAHWPYCSQVCRSFCFVLSIQKACQDHFQIHLRCAVPRRPGV